MKPRRIRVLIVDDSMVVRHHLEAVLGRESDIEITPSAANGRIALAMVANYAPDVVVLDLKMEDLDGYEVLRSIRRMSVQLAVIIYTAWNDDGSVSRKAKAFGANDCLSKPRQVHSHQAAERYVQTTLLAKIRQFSPMHPPLTALPPAKRKRVPHSTVQVLAIGASTGGPDAIVHLLKSLPYRLSIPIVIVQHMPPMFTHMFAERLNAQTVHTVRESMASQGLSAGDVWIAAGDYHMIVTCSNHKITLRNHHGMLENHSRPSVDVLFRSVAEVYGAHVLAVVLTGIGQDGLKGCQAIHQKGGQILVQDEASSTVWGMPKAVFDAGLADAVLPLPALSEEILRRVLLGSAPTHE
ncbi:MAG: chemotaxis-specific protein-glutamate methyltransferase CheB [Mariprofundaceae bacterium]|nr:chemotaxis-specific protein-glutamate methyltransferase CheB [Mariprofundaceae bacterium]